MSNYSRNYIIHGILGKIIGKNLMNIEARIMKTKNSLIHEKKIVL